MTTGLERRRRTKPIIWFAACVCAILAVAVTIGGAAVISVYVANRPKIPHLQVTGGHLDRLSYDQKGILDLALQLSVSAVNSNGKAHAVISQVDLRLSFAAAPLAVLAADAFEIGKNSSRVLNYEVETAAAPLDAAAMEKMDLALKNGRVEFGLVGRARTRWHIGPVVSVNIWTHLDCTLPFFYPGGDPAADLRRCISKSHWKKTNFSSKWWNKMNMRGFKMMDREIECFQKLMKSEESDKKSTKSTVEDSRKWERRSDRNQSLKGSYWSFQWSKPIIDQISYLIVDQLNCDRLDHPFELMIKKITDFIVHPDFIDGHPIRL